MSRLKKLFVIGLFILGVLGVTSLTASKAFTHSAAQPVQSDGGQTLQALLGEVHQLRVALQRSNLNTYHAQITIERMKLQQQRVDRLTSQLNDIHHQLADTRAAMAKFSTIIKNMESEATKEMDAVKRADREQGYQSFKSELEEATQKEQLQQQDEIQLTAQLQVEQAKLTELSDRLDTLQRELETQMSTDKQPLSGKRPEQH